MSDTKTGLVTLEEFEYEDPIPIPNTLRRSIAVRPMVLMGSGPTNPSQRVIEALCKPIMGLHTPEFIQVCYLSISFLLSVDFTDDKLFANSILFFSYNVKLEQEFFVVEVFS